MGRYSNDIQVKVFISHQWRDKLLADRLACDLEEFADVWMDFRNLRPGDHIQNTIDKSLEEMDLVILVWTEHAQKSSGVNAEIRTCFDLGIRIIPCFFAYDNEGNGFPPLPESLNQILGVDFHHYGSGLAQLADLILHLQKERLPKEVAMDQYPGMRMLQYLRGYLSYLANYRNLQGVPDQRADWVNKIISEIEQYMSSGGNKSLVRMLLEAARRSDVDDPEGIGKLVTRLERILGDASSAKQPAVPMPQPPSPGEFQPSKWRKPPAPPVDLLMRRVAEVVPAGTAYTWISQVDNYLNNAPVALQALDSYARAMGSQAGGQVVAYLHNYLNNADDLIPDHEGRYGLLDDAWLILNTAFRLIESGLVSANAVPVDWKTIIAADYVVRSIIPQEVLVALTEVVSQMLQLIAVEVSSYQPWFTPQGHGYAPTMAAPARAGGTWEDQMNAALLGTGLSFN